MEVVATVVATITLTVTAETRVEDTGTRVGMVAAAPVVEAAQVVMETKV